MRREKHIRRKWNKAQPLPPVGPSDIILIVTSERFVRSADDYRERKSNGPAGRAKHREHKPRVLLCYTDHR
jgi:hypothetical protein